MMAAACDKVNGKDDLVESSDIKYVENGLMFGNTVHFNYVYTASFDSKGRIGTITCKHYEQVRNEDGYPAASGETFLAETSTTTYSYDEGARTARVKDSSTWYTQDGKQDGETNINSWNLILNDDWNITRAIYNPGTESEYSEDYTYSDGRMTTCGQYNLEWQNGNIVRRSNPRYVGTDIYEYGKEANPFKDGIDVTFGFLLPQEYIFGLMGAHCSNLPVSHTYTDGASESVSKFEYTRDKSGRITKIREVYVDSETDNNAGNEIPYHYWSICYK